MSFNASRRGWYSTGHRLKLWITSEQVNQVLTCIWAKWHLTNPGQVTVLKRITVHTVIQFFDCLALRSVSLLDDAEREIGTIGRYLRWGYLTFRLVKHSGDEGPEFVVIGQGAAAKNSSRAGDKNYHEFIIGTRKSNGGDSAARDLALGLIILAVLQNALGDNLQKAITNPSFASHLLTLSATGYYDFQCTPAFCDSPVFVTEIDAQAHDMKHPTDKTPFGDQYKPMTNRQMAAHLKALGKLTGFENVLNYSTFRRTWSLMAYLNHITDDKIKLGMGHRGQTNHLHQQVYKPSILPIDDTSTWFGESSVTTTSRQAIMQISALATRPDPSLFDPEDIARIAQLLLEFSEGNASDDQIIDAFAGIGSGQRLPLPDALQGLLQFIRDDELRYSFTDNHPYLNPCNNSILKILQFVLEHN